VFLNSVVQRDPSARLKILGNLVPAASIPAVPWRVYTQLAVLARCTAAVSWPAVDTITGSRHSSMQELRSFDRNVRADDDLYDDYLRYLKQQDEDDR
jgi:hypothetical protein